MIPDMRSLHAIWMRKLHVQVYNAEEVEKVFKENKDRLIVIMCKVCAWVVPEVSGH
jgi:hypothetical protein